jgi:hypothetical protein
MKYFCTLFFLLFFLIAAQAQKSFRLDQAPRVEVNGKVLDLPFAGGINAAQLQSMDVNGDGQEELVIWDRNSRRLLVFEEGDNGFIYKPELTYSFPEDVNGYLILVDYNGNGRKDLFTSSPFGIKAYRNMGHANQVLQWEVAQNFLRLEGGSNIQANNLDIPVIMDIDGDGDLDIVTFNFAVGDYLEFYKNTSIERKGTADIDAFASAKVRWGGFEFCGCGQFSFGFTCAGNPIQQVENYQEENLRIQHIGGHSLLLHDFTGNGVLDMVMGQDECNILYYLPNTGTNESPVFASFSTTLPGLGPLPSFPIFHIGSLYKGDFIISLNASSRAQEFDIDFSRSIRRFPREGNGWQPESQHFLQDQMVDLGENAKPLFLGNSSQGELLVTANQVLNGAVTGVVTKFTLDQNGFTLKEEDYLNFSALGLTDLQIQPFGNYFFYSGNTIENFIIVRTLYYNAGGPDFSNSRQITLPEVTLRGNDHLEFFENENQIYLLLARQTGELIRYRVSFNPDPVFTLLDRNYLGFTDNPATRNLTIHVVKEPGSQHPDLYAIDQRGRLMVITDFLSNNNLQDEILLVRNTPVNTKFGRHSWISSIPNIFEGKVDLLMGTAAGGLIYLSQETFGTPGEERDWQVKLYPNPTVDFLTIISSEAATGQLISPLGQVLLYDIPLPAGEATQISLLPYARGMYYLQISDSQGKVKGKKVIKK